MVRHPEEFSNGNADDYYCVLTATSVPQVLANQRWARCIAYYEPHAFRLTTQHASSLGGLTNKLESLNTNHCGHFHVLFCLVVTFLSRHVGCNALKR
jgi:hypothetical protein